MKKTFEDEQALNDARQQANRELVQRLADLVEAHPSQRFGQIMRNFGFVEQQGSDRPISWRDEFSREPWDILDRVQDRLNPA